MPRNSTTARISRSLTTEFHAEPRTPDTITYAVTTAAPIQIAAVDEIAPYDAVATMMPSPFSCSTRYGINAATPTSATSTPSAGLSYFREKKCDCDTSRWLFAKRQIGGSIQYDTME